MLAYGARYEALRIKILSIEVLTHNTPIDRSNDEYNFSS